HLEPFVVRLLNVFVKRLQPAGRYELGQVPERGRRDVIRRASRGGIEDELLTSSRLVVDLQLDADARLFFELAFELLNGFDLVALFKKNPQRGALVRGSVASWRNLVGGPPRGASGD